MERSDAARLLDVAPDAPADAVRRAFRRRVRQHHPDHAGADRKGASHEVAMLVEARRTLLSPPPVEEVPPPPAPGGDGPAGPGGTATDRSTDTLLDDVSIVGNDALLVRDEPAVVMARLVEVGHALGEVTYLDRRAGLIEVLLQVQEEDDRAPAACSLVCSLQGRAEGIEIFCTVERLDGHPAPDIAAVVAALAHEMTAPLPG